MEIRFYNDADTDQPHIYNHGVSEQEAIEVLRRAGEDRPAEGRSRAALGQTVAGRYLKVIYVPDDDRAGLCVITAFDLRGNALKSYKRRRRRYRS